MMTFLILLLTVPLLPAPSGPDLALENELLELKKKAQRTHPRIQMISGAETFAIGPTVLCGVVA